MRENVRRRIVEVITEDVYWLKVISDDEVRWLKTVGSSAPFPHEPEDIIVRVQRRHKSFRRGMVFNIPASSICQAVLRLSLDRKFEQRCALDRLTKIDVKDIILKATSGILEIDFFDY